MAKINHYVEFFFPGVMCSGTEVRKIKERLPQSVKNIPQQAYSFRFFDRIEDEVAGRKLASDAENYSGIYFLGGEIKTVEQVLKEDPKSVLAMNMVGNGMDKVVKTKFGQHIKFNKGDCII